MLDLRRRTATADPVATSHNRTVWSSLPEASSVRPRGSAANATELTRLVWPVSGGPNLLPLAGFHSWTVPLAAPEASSKNLPNLPNVTDSTWSVRMAVVGVPVRPRVSGHSRIVPSSLAEASIRASGSPPNATDDTPRRCPTSGCRRGWPVS